MSPLRDKRLAKTNSIQTIIYKYTVWNHKTIRNNKCNLLLALYSSSMRELATKYYAKYVKHYVGEDSLVLSYSV